MAHSSSSTLADGAAASLASPTGSLSSFASPAPPSLGAQGRPRGATTDVSGFERLRTSGLHGGMRLSLDTSAFPPSWPSSPPWAVGGAPPPAGVAASAATASRAPLSPSWTPLAAPAVLSPPLAAAVPAALPTARPSASATATAAAAAHRSQPLSPPRTHRIADVYTEAAEAEATDLDGCPSAASSAGGHTWGAVAGRPANGRASGVASGVASGAPPHAGGGAGGRTDYAPRTPEGSRGLLVEWLRAAAVGTPIRAEADESLLSARCALLARVCPWRPNAAFPRGNEACMPLGRPKPPANSARRTARLQPPAAPPANTARRTACQHRPPHRPPTPHVSTAPCAARQHRMPAPPPAPAPPANTAPTDPC